MLNGIKAMESMVENRQIIEQVFTGGLFEVAAELVVKAVAICLPFMILITTWNVVEAAIEDLSKIGSGQANMFACLQLAFLPACGCLK